MSLILDRIDNGWLLSSPGLFARYFATGEEVLPYIQEWIKREEIEWLFPAGLTPDDDPDDTGNYS